MNRTFQTILFTVCGILSSPVIVSAASAEPVVQVSNMSYSYEQMQTDLEILKKMYPDKIHTNSLEVTADSREITEVILGQEDAPCHILIQAAIHAREYMNTLLAMNQIEDYLRYYDERSYENCLWSELYKDVCFHVIPMANPDGTAISQLGIQGIHDSAIQDMLLECYNNDSVNGKGSGDMDLYFRTWKSNARGVDLNRNFDIGWDVFVGTAYPSTDRYKGTEAFSEPETRAILEIAQKYQLACCISYHSFGNLIYWNYGSDGEVLEADRKLAECVSNVTQYELHSTIQDAADSAGCSDYFVLKLGIPAVTIENGGTECPLPVEEYQPIYERNQNLWPALAYLYTKNSA